MGDGVRHPIAQKKHQMFGKRYLHDQSAAPNMPQQANGSSVPIPPQPDMPIKYEFDPYPGHHPLATGLDGPTSSVQLQVTFRIDTKKKRSDDVWLAAAFASNTILIGTDSPP